MVQVAKLFQNGRSQAVRLPKEFQFEGSEVYIRRDSHTGDIVLSSRFNRFADFVALAKRLNVEVPEDFLSPQERDMATHLRDPFEGWEEL